MEHRTVYNDFTVLARADHFTLGRKGPLDSLIIHSTAGTNSLAWLTSTSNPPVSAHVLIKRDGTRYHLVADGDTAWHAGFSKLVIGQEAVRNVNDRSLGVELENLNDGIQPITLAQYDSLAHQVATWLMMYPRMRSFTHASVDPRKTDPRNFDWTYYTRAVAMHLRDILAGELERTRRPI